jgi:DNA-binding transcriptional MocR family regulator
MVLAKFLERGLVERNLRRNQRLLSNRRQRLVIALMKAFGQRLSISKESSGTNLQIRFNDCAQELIEQAARDSGFPMICTASYYMRPTTRKEYLLPFATIDDEALMQATAAFAEKVGKIEKQSSDQIDFNAQTTPAELTVFELDDPYDLARLNNSMSSHNFAAHRLGNGVTTP